MKDIWQKVDKTNTCWNWRGCVVAGKYGQVRFEGRRHYVHRVAAYLAGKLGSLADNMDVHHTCENKLCVKPDHLVVMTPEEHHNLHKEHKITRQQAEEIRERYELGELQKDLAAEFGISAPHVSRICAGKKWK